MKLNIDLKNLKSIVNPKFYLLLFDRHRYIIFRGGRGSGKTYFICQKIIYRILRDVYKLPNFQHNFLCMRKHTSNCNRSIVKDINTIIKQWNLSHLFIYNKVEKIFTFVPNDSQIICTGVDDPEKIKGISNITSLWMEEATEFNNEDFVLIDGSLRGKHNKSYYQTILSFNPVSDRNWVYKTLFRNQWKEATYHHSTFKDNRYLDDDYKNTLYRLVGTNDRAKKVLIDGEWGKYDEAIIYPDFTIVSTWDDKYIEGEIVVGVDFGYTHHAAVSRVAHYKDGLLFDELLYQTGLTNEALADKIKPLVGKLRCECDNSRPEAIDTLCSKGIRAYPCKKGKDSVQSGISFILSKPIYVTERSVNMIKELELYSRKRDKDNNILDEPEKEFDDLMDSNRYAASRFNIHKKGVQNFYMF